MIVLALLFGLFTFLSLNWHSHSPAFTYHSEIWADRAGYHMYLPAAINHHFDPSKFPEGIDKRTGNGFQLDSVPGRISTKYTCGIALLRLPFYLIGDLFRPDAEAPLTGFSAIDHVMVDVASAFYGALGLVLLWGLLLRRSSPTAATLAVFGVLAGTNLLYYVIADPGMSHSYSFFLFALFMFLIERGIAKGWTKRMAVCVGTTAGLIVLIRPTNVVLLPVGMYLISGSWDTMVAQCKAFLRPSFVISALVPSTSILLLQFLYWQYLYGVPVVWSYGSEGFTNWKNPQLLRFWFAPYNGLFAYAPFLLITLLASLLPANGRPSERTSAWIVLVVVSYLSASWFSTFGCGFGARTFVEYTTVLAFPMATMFRKESRIRWPLIAALGLCTAYTLKLMYSYDSCWFGETWDWSLFRRLLFGPFK